MDRRSRRSELYTVFSALTDYLRLFQRKLVNGGHYDTVARGIDLTQSILYLFIGTPDIGKLFEQRQQVAFAFYLDTRCLAEDPVEKLAF